MLEAEKAMRDLANEYHNSYVIAIFACCRDIYEQEPMMSNKKPLQQIVSRGQGAINIVQDPINLILIWGCRPGDGVRADTKMC